MKKFLTLIIILLSVGACSQEAIYLECRGPTLSPSVTGRLFTLYPDKDEVRKTGQYTETRISWSPTTVTINVAVRVPTSIWRINRETLKYTYTDQRGDIGSSAGKCGIIEARRNQI